jgi:HK97 gp10 family phage protein
MRISIDIVGNPELQSVWRDATDKHMLRALRAGMTRVGAVVRSKARSLVPVETGVLKRSIGQKVGRNKVRSAHYVVIGPRKQFKEKGRWPVKYAHLVEGGTQPHTIKRRGRTKTIEFRHKGATAKPFMAPALEMTRPQIQAILRDAATKALQRMKARAAA